MMSLTEAERNKLLEELRNFGTMLVNYQRLDRVLSTPGIVALGRQRGDFDNTRRDLQIVYGHLKSVIDAYGGPAVVKVGAMERNAFGFALTNSEPSEGTVTALDACIAVVNMAIGKLKSPNIGCPKVQDTPAASIPPKAFIAHGGQTARLKKLSDFLKALGVEPVIAEWRESEGRWIEEHVDKLMSDSDCYIILAEYGGIIDVKTGAKHPRLNVVDELGRSREKRPTRTILLLEKGVDLSSNDKGIVYEHFTKQNMEKAFIKIAKELVAFGIIKAVKP